MDELRLNLPLNLLQNLQNKTSPSVFACEGTNGKRFHITVTPISGHLQFCFTENFIEDGLIDIRTFSQLDTHVQELDYRPEIDYRYSTRSFTKINNISIERMETGQGGSPIDENSVRKSRNEGQRLDVVDKPSEEMVNGMSFGDLSAYADYVSGNYKCKACGFVFTSSRRLVCHVEKHGGYRPWSCAECDYSASFQSLLIAHVSREHSSFHQESETPLRKFSKKLGRNQELLEIEIVNQGNSVVDIDRVGKSGLVSDSSGIVVDKLAAGALSGDVEAQTIAVEIEVQPPRRKRRKRSGIIRLDKNTASENKDNDTIAPSPRKQRNKAQTESSMENRDIIIQGPPDLDPRLRKIARNYQMVIHEYCKIERDSFKCLQCTASFKKRNNFMNHLYNSHEKCLPYFCLFCDFRTRGKPNVFTHNSYKHKSNSPYKCVECSVSFVTKFKYEDHMDKLHNSREIVYHCEHCEKHFYSRHELRDHKKLTHEIRVLHSCDYCDKTFTTANALKLHVNVHIPGRRYKCAYCQKLYRSQQSLRIHMHSHTTIFHCQICDKNLYSYSAFIVHKNLHDPKAKKHPCSVCGKLFPRRKIRDRHVILKHSDMESKYKCERCSKSFKLNEQLVAHMVCHSTDTPWVCEICKKAFKRQSSLCTHQKSHGKLNTAPFICAFCPKVFETYDELADHLTKVEKAGLCTLCRRLFSSKALLDQHLLSAHRQRESVLKQYLTEPIENIQEYQGVEKTVEVSGGEKELVSPVSGNNVIVQEREVPGKRTERVTIVGPSLISYDSEGKPTVVEGLNNRAAIQIAPGPVS